MRPAEGDTPPATTEPASRVGPNRATRRRHAQENSPRRKLRAIARLARSIRKRDAQDQRKAMKLAARKNRTY